MLKLLSSQQGKKRLYILGLKFLPYNSDVLLSYFINSFMFYNQFKVALESPFVFSTRQQDVKSVAQE